MGRSVYVASFEGYTGKSTVALGLLEQLSRRVGRIGVFRPVVRADTSDLYGNLTFRYAQANFGPAMATAASLVVAEVRAVETEPIPHERVQLPGSYVDRVVTVEG